MGGSNPTNAELEEFRRAGFTLVVSFLDEGEQQPAYDPDHAVKLGFRRENIGVKDFHAPSIDQLSAFVALVESETEGKTVVHCQGGTGRTGTAAAAYWIAKGLTFEDAVAKVRQARPRAVETEDQLAVLRAFAEKAAGPTSRPR